MTLLPSTADAQTIATDRPGFAFSPVAVPARGLQGEFGLPTLDYAGGGDDPVAGLVAALRYGVSDRLEARLSTVFYARTPGAAGQDGPTGIGGLRAGVKLGVLADPSLTLSVIPEVVLPVGEDELAGDRAAFSVNASAGMPVGSASLTLVGGAQWDPVGEEAYDATGLLVALLGRSFTESFSAYLEGAFLPGPGDDAAYAGVGAAWLVSLLVQLDASADIGLTQASSDAIVGVGFSFLIH